MTYKEFIDKISNLNIGLYYLKQKDKYSRKEYIQRNLNTKLEELVLYWSWHTGGQRGGNCWNNNQPHAYTSDETEPEFTDLDSIIENLAPNIGYLAYKKNYERIEPGS